MGRGGGCNPPTPLPTSASLTSELSLCLPPPFSALPLIVAADAVVKRVAAVVKRRSRVAEVVKRWSRVAAVVTPLI